MAVYRSVASMRLHFPQSAVSVDPGGEVELEFDPGTKWLVPVGDPAPCRPAFEVDPVTGRCVPCEEAAVRAVVARAQRAAVRATKKAAAVAAVAAVEVVVETPPVDVVPVVEVEPVVPVVVPESDLSVPVSE